MVLEARGLDVTPATVDRFRAVGDEASARILERILRDEIRHVAAGTKWFESGCAENRFAAETHWQMLGARHLPGRLKAPLNDSAREAYGLTREYYKTKAELQTPLQPHLENSGIAKTSGSR